ncbi:hypothetical protein MSC49_00880 [Methylosinus sp. C49]|jgi:hypothetical protein|uniref:hypothetical protein n=1 Tax=Hyphomicrobiales TaxID=356 RepID=UPI000465769F|nr:MULTISPECIES: hypothetical protein [unclassified Methylosinus]OAI23536.1 hypothetical protein A1351_19105 [Methylosinus sp. R-45379]TDX66543.1 hypothetical protein EDE12_10174 [Methylosinus sp. sav-2]BBU60153.1 hypothetical protein MSC49_00880 [Methylosinus sp. C49]
MRHFVSLSAGLACLLALATAGEALAKTHRSAHRHFIPAEGIVVATGPIPYVRQPLVVPRRSWLDPGPVVPVGSTNRYMVEATYFAYQPMEDNQRSWFMQETLPNRRRFEVLPYRDGIAPIWWP